MDQVPKTTSEVNRHVIRDSVGTIVFVAVYGLLVMWLATGAHRLAMFLFWIGAIFAGLRAIQVVIIVGTGTILFVARRFGWKPEGADPNTLVASLVIFLELLVCVSMLYYVYRHL